MYTTAKKSFYNTGDCVQTQNVIECVNRARAIAKKKKAELEIKLICVLLIFGNIFALAEMSKTNINLWGYFPKSIIVAAAVIIVCRGIKNMISFFKNN